MAIIAPQMRLYKVNMPEGNVEQVIITDHLNAFHFYYGLLCDKDPEEYPVEGLGTTSKEEIIKIYRDNGYKTFMELHPKFKAERYLEYYLRGNSLKKEILSVMSPAKEKPSNPIVN